MSGFCKAMSASFVRGVVTVITSQWRCGHAASPSDWDHLESGLQVCRSLPFWNLASVRHIANAFNLFDEWMAESQVRNKGMRVAELHSWWGKWGPRCPLVQTRSFWLGIGAESESLCFRVQLSSFWSLALPLTSQEIFHFSKPCFFHLHPVD